MLEQDEKFKEKVARLVRQSGNLEPEEPEPWRFSNWKEMIKVLVFLVVSLDYMHQHSLYIIGRDRGGFVPIVLVAFFSVTTHLPSMQLYAQIGHFIQASSVKVWGTYGRAFGWIGLLMLLSSSYESSLQIYHGSNDITIWLEGKNITRMTTCQGKMDIYGDRPYRDECCMSLIDKLICQRRKPRPDWCRKIDPFLCFPVPPTFSDVRSISARQTMAYVSEVHFVAAGLLAVVTPVMVFFGLTVAVGVIGILGSLVCCFFFIESGDLSTGFSKMWRFTRLSAVTEFEMWYEVMVTVLLYSCSKFTVISVASTIPRRNRLYLPLLFCYFIHISIILIYFLSDLAIFGALEKGSETLQMPTSVPLIGMQDINLVVVPEFIRLAGMNEIWIFIFDLSVTMMRSAAFVSPLVCALATYYRHKHCLIKRTTLICFVVFIQSVILFILYTTEGTTSDLLKDHLNVLNCLLVVFSLVTGISIYGLMNHTHDLYRTYPITSWKRYHYLGPTSPFYFGCLQNVIWPSIVTFLILSLLNMSSNWDSYQVHEEAKMYGAVRSLLVYVLYATVAAVVIAKDVVIPWYKDQQRLWETLFPTEEHPAFTRISLWRLKEAVVEEEKETANRYSQETNL